MRISDWSSDVCSSDLIDMADSLYPVVLKGDAETYRPISEVIRKTHYHGLDLIPANLHLYNAEYEIASRLPTFGPTYLTGLKQAIAPVSQNYDVVIIEPQIGRASCRERVCQYV